MTILFQAKITGVSGKKTSTGGVGRRDAAQGTYDYQLLPSGPEARGIQAPYDLKLGDKIWVDPGNRKIHGKAGKSQ